MNTQNSSWFCGLTTATRTLRWEPPITSSAAFQAALASCSGSAASTATRSWAWLWFGGIHGDKKLGMEQLLKTIDHGRYLQPFAKILLALAARREKKDALAQKLLRELSQEFPESSLYSAEYAKAMGRLVPTQMHP